MISKLFKFSPNRIKHHHKRGVAKRRPWKSMVFSLVLAAAMVGGVSQTDMAKNNISYWAASHAPSYYLSGLDRSEAATMAGRIAELNKSEPIAKVDNSKYVFAVSRLFAESQMDERAAIAASFVNKTGDLGVVAEISSPLREEMITSLVEEVLYSGDKSQRQNAVKALTHFAMEQDDTAIVNLLSAMEPLYEFAASDNSWVISSVERIARKANRAEDKTMSFAALRNIMGKIGDERLEIEAARAFAAEASEHVLSKMSQNTVDVLMKPMLRGYLHNKLIENNKRAEEINVEMTRVETYAKEKFVSGSYYKVVPQSTFNITDKEFSDMDHEHAGFLISWLAGAANNHKDAAVKKKSAETLERMYVNIGLDPDFLKYYAPHRAKWHKYVKSHEKELDVLSNIWKNIDDAQRLAALIPWAKKHSEIFGFDDIAEVVTYKCSQTPKKKKCAKTSNAYHGGKSDNININAEISNWKSFEDTFATLIHENTHHHQDQLVKLMREKKLTKKDPRYGQVYIFSSSIGYYVTYEPKKNNYKAYQSHPWERHAWWTTKNLKNARPKLSRWKSLAIDDAPNGLEGKYVNEGTGDAKPIVTKNRVRLPKP